MASHSSRWILIVALVAMLGLPLTAALMQAAAEAALRERPHGEWIGDLEAPLKAAAP